MKRTLTTLLLLALLCPAARARQGQAMPLRPRLVDSFGAVMFSDLMARLDNFAVELQNDPSATGMVVAYAARHKFPGWPLRRAHAALAYLVESRRLDPARLSAVNGGLRDDTTFELWLVPFAAEPPVKPFDPALLMSREKTPVAFDRFTVAERGDRVEAEIYWAEPRPDAPSLYGHFAEVLRSDPSLRGCVIGYTSRRGRRAADRRIASAAKRALATAHGVDASRVVALGGGRREYKMVELWLVPPGAELPRPTPEAPRGRRGRRRS